MALGVHQLLPPCFASSLSRRREQHPPPRCSETAPAGANWGLFPQLEAMVGLWQGHHPPGAVRQTKGRRDAARDPSGGAAAERAGLRRQPPLHQAFNRMHRRSVCAARQTKPPEINLPKRTLWKRGGLSIACLD